MDGIKNINLNKALFNKNSNTIKFEVQPIDVNIALMQFNLQKRCLNEVPEHGSFAPVIEEYTNKDYRVNINRIKTVCCSNSEDKNKRDLVVSIDNPARTKEYSCLLFSGTKQEILEYLKNQDNILFSSIKQMVDLVSEENRRKS